MAVLTKVGKVAAPLAGAVFIQPLLNFFAPSIRPLVKNFIESDAAKEFLKDLIEGGAVAGPGVCTILISTDQFFIDWDDNLAAILFVTTRNLEKSLAMKRESRLLTLNTAT